MQAQLASAQNSRQRVLLPLRALCKSRMATPAPAREALVRTQLGQEWRLLVRPPPTAASLASAGLRHRHGPGFAGLGRSAKERRRALFGFEYEHAAHERRRHRLAEAEAERVAQQLDEEEQIAFALINRRMMEAAAARQEHAYSADVDALDAEAGRELSFGSAEERRSWLLHRALWDDSESSDDSNGSGSERRRPSRDVLDEFPDLRVLRTKGRAVNFSCCAPMDREPFKFGADLSTETWEVSPLVKQCVKQCVQLTERQMRGMYDAARWKWDASKVRRRFNHPDSRFIVAETKGLPAGESDAGSDSDADAGSQQSRMLGFANFRFMTEDEAAVLYVMELQVDLADVAVRRSGVATHMMGLLERVARYWGMEWIMLTTFKKVNPVAYRFYTEKLGYEIDETSPTDKAHVILSKRL